MHHKKMILIHFSPAKIAIFSGGNPARKGLKQLGAPKCHMIHQEIKRARNLQRENHGKESENRWFLHVRQVLFLIPFYTSS